MVPTSNSRSKVGDVPRRVRRRDARRDVILRAAAERFRHRGFAGTGMRDIADAADLSAANLYHYFRGKDEILFYCQDRALDRMLASVAAARRAPATAVDRLRQVLAAHVRTLLDDVDGATAHLQLDALPPALRARIVGKRDRYEAAVRRLVAEACPPVARAGDPAIIARAMLGAANWTVTWFDPGGSMSAAAVGDAIAQFLVNGLRSGGRAPLARKESSHVR